jgi:hypothetical protein
VSSTPTSFGTTSARDGFVLSSCKRFVALASIGFVVAMFAGCVGEVGAIATKEDTARDLGLTPIGPTISAERNPSSGYLLYHGSPVDPWCGAVLVDPKKVLTAGRCVQDVLQRGLTVGFGALNGGYLHRVESITLPLGYRSDGPAIEDIAVVALRDPVDDVPPAILAMRTVEPDKVSLVSYVFVGAGDFGDRRVFDGSADHGSDADLWAVFPGAETNCHGEIGAGLFRSNDGPTDELIGIGSSGSYDRPHPLSPDCVGRLSFASIAHNRDFMRRAGVAFASDVR